MMYPNNYLLLLFSFPCSFLPLRPQPELLLSELLSFQPLVMQPLPEKTSDMNRTQCRVWLNCRVKAIVLFITKYVVQDSRVTLVFVSYLSSSAISSSSSFAASSSSSSSSGIWLAPFFKPTTVQMLRISVNSRKCKLSHLTGRPTWQFSLHTTFSGLG